jgi:hypothetical protein
MIYEILLAFNLSFEGVDFRLYLAVLPCLGLFTLAFKGFI